MIRNRTLTVTYELPEELWNVLEEKANREGRPIDIIVAEYKLNQSLSKMAVTPEEAGRQRGALIAHFGTGVSDDSESSDNDRIDADLAREYQGEQ